MLNGNTTTYRSVPELDPLMGELTGTEIFPMVRAGKTYRRSWTTCFGDGWFSVLRAAFSSLVAPDAIRADQADAALFADDADAVSGLSFEDGKGLDRFEEVRIAAKGAWVIPSGTFQIYAWSAASVAALMLEADDARVPGTWGLRGPFPAGLVVSDGVSQRIRNTSTAEIGITYRVLVHKS